MALSKYCPIVKRNVIYQYCEDCTDKPCRYSHTDSFDNRHTKKTNVIDDFKESEGMLHGNKTRESHTPYGDAIQ